MPGLNVGRVTKHQCVMGDLLQERARGGRGHGPDGSGLTKTALGPDRRHLILDSYKSES